MPIMNRLRASGVALATCVRALTKTEMEIEFDLMNLDQKVASLRGVWTGAASDAYDVAHREWAQQLSELRELLAQHGKNLDAVDRRYRETSLEIRKILSGPIR